MPAAGGPAPEACAMRLSDVSIKRPVFATVLSLLLIVLGLMAFTRSPLRELPAIDPPIVSVDVTYPGASAGVVETRVTQVLEDALSGIEGVETCWSRAASTAVRRSRIEFSLDRDIEAPPTTSAMRSAASATACRKRPIRRRWRRSRRDAEVDPVAEHEFDRMDTLALTDYADRYVVDRNCPPRRRGADPHRRRAALRHAHLAGSRCAGRARPHRRRRRSRRCVRENVELPAGRLESETATSPCASNAIIEAEDFAKLP
jgi:multidrug efflux pump